MRSGCERSLGVETGASALTQRVGQLSGTLGLLPVLAVRICPGGSESGEPFGGVLAPAEAAWTA